jgi:hypothetical protein
MGDRPEVGQANESSRPLDGMDRAKDARQQIVVLGIFLKRDDFRVELREVFPALRQKILKNFVIHRNLFSVGSGEADESSTLTDGTVQKSNGIGADPKRKARVWCNYSNRMNGYSFPLLTYRHQEENRLRTTNR